MAYTPIMPNMKLTAQDMGGADYMKAIQKGFQGAADVYKPQTAASTLLEKMLKNKISQPYADNANEWFQADLGYKQALAEQARRGGSPFASLMGPAREAYSLEILKNQLGEDSPAYLAAKEKYDLENESQRGLNSYRQGLADTMLKRTSSNIGKLDQEEADVAAGFEPNTNRQHQITPDRQEELLGQYQLAKQKVSTDTDTRKKVLFATNIDKTINAIDPKDLTSFAGAKGAIDLKKEELKSLSNPGSESEKYRRYLEAANKAQLLSKQVRQFYGDSIQPATLDKLEKLANPATWRNNPEVATRLYKSFTDLLKQETMTYKDALRSKKVFQGRQSEQNSPKRYNLSTGRFE